MKQILVVVCVLTLSFLEAEVSLDNLIASSKVECFEKLKTTNDAELWSVFLEAQTNLFFNSEFEWISKCSWWLEAQNILEIGSGNGSYLNKLSQQSQGKKFKGIELLSKSVEQSNEQYEGGYLTFEEGNAEIYNDKLRNTADIVLFRLTLQHLKDPILALENAAEYLSSNGYVVIIDTYDKARQTSHPMDAIDKAFDLAAKAQKGITGKGNRKISFELLQALEAKNSPIGELYKVEYSNLDIEGKITDSIVRFEGEKERKLFVNLGLLLVELFHRTYQIPVDLNALYGELQDYLKDENAWTSPGWHFLVLKKKG